MPKCMAPVNGKPFLAYLFAWLNKQKCTRVILSLGYKHQVVTDWLEDQDLQFELDYVIENEPLGTGGGILAAMEEAVTDDVAVVNGDTLFMGDLQQLLKYHRANSAAVSIALKQMQQFERYGTVHLSDDGIITAFKEKQFQEIGLINGGVYVIDREAFLAQKLPGKFSFEKDYLERFVVSNKIRGLVQDNYFIDIGVPDDYAQAQADFKTMFL